MSDWYVVYTQPNGEARALANLRRQGYEAYLPRYRRRRTHARKTDIVERPLFPRYLFVALDLMRARWRPILSTFGVCDVVRNGDQPAPVPAGVVEEIRAGEESHSFDAVDPLAGAGAGSAVRILSGPFADLVGRLQSAAESERVVLLLDLLGREVCMCMPRHAVALA
ncbi:MAG: transcriptional activator RfaH [Alphaproteobacteria bacterium]|nr:transcriptional activator RfaH [Alphaproteobacteria bacterium]